MSRSSFLTTAFPGNILTSRKAYKYRTFKTPISSMEGVGPGAPPGEDEGEADSLEDLGRGTDCYGVDRSLLGEELSEVLRESLESEQDVSIRKGDILWEQRWRRRLEHLGRRRPCS